MIHAGYKGSRKNTLHANAEYALFLPFISRKNHLRLFYYFNAFRHCMKTRLKIFILDMNINLNKK